MYATVYQSKNNDPEYFHKKCQKISTFASKCIKTPSCEESNRDERAQTLIYIITKVQIAICNRLSIEASPGKKLPPSISMV